MEDKRCRAREFATRRSSGMMASSSLRLCAAAQFLGAVPPEPADAGICAALPKKPHVFKGKAHLPHHLGTGKALMR
jgi:hypothetical protein